MDSLCWVALGLAGLALILAGYSMVTQWLAGRRIKSTVMEMISADERNETLFDFKLDR